MLQKYMNTDDLSSDDEEGDINTIGRVPLHWYDAYDHIGYDIGGSKVFKSIKKDRIDMALSSNDKSTANRVIIDMYNNREVVLSDRDLEIIRRIQAGAYAHPEFDETPEYIDYESSIREKMPISAIPEPKRRFKPSKWEFMKVIKIMKAIKEGNYITQKDMMEKRKQENKIKSLSMIWNDDEMDITENNRQKYHLPAPKMPLPGHAESYNPPEEYLLTEVEKIQYENLDPTDRPYNFEPKKHLCLRHVGGYSNFIKERFERCLDLYLCPRKLKRRLNIDPDTLVPRLPRPNELRPFPNNLCNQYIGHQNMVRGITVSPDGQYLASCSDDNTVRLWEVDTALCRYIWTFDNTVVYIKWNPNPMHHIIAVACKNTVVLIHTGTGDADATEITESLLAGVLDSKSNDNKDSDDEADVEVEDGEGDDDDNKSNGKQNRNKPVWRPYLSKTKNKIDKNTNRSLMTIFGSKVGPRAILELSSEVSKVCWHHKGDYLCSLAPAAGASAVAIHQISKGKSQFPFKKSPGNVQCVEFHPSRPFMFIATQQHVKVYHLIEQKMMKRLLSGCKWISSMDVHSSGDHVILGSYDRRLVWFDLDLSSSPFKTMKFHEKALRHVIFHR